METQLTYDNRSRSLGLFAKERFVSDDNVVFTVEGNLDTATGACRGQKRNQKWTILGFKMVPPKKKIGGTVEKIVPPKSLKSDFSNYPQIGGGRPGGGDILTGFNH